MAIFQRDIDAIWLWPERLITFTSAMKPFWKLTNFEKFMKNLYELLLRFAINRASPWQLFSVIFIPSGSNRKDF